MHMHARHSWSRPCWRKQPHLWHTLLCSCWQVCDKDIMTIKQLGAGACATVSRPGPPCNTAAADGARRQCRADSVDLLTDGRPAGFCAAAAAAGTHRKPSCVVFVFCAGAQGLPQAAQEVCCSQARQCHEQGGHTRNLRRHDRCHTAWPAHTHAGPAVKTFSPGNQHKQHGGIKA